MLLQWSFCSKFVHFIIKIAIIRSASDLTLRAIFDDWQQRIAQFADRQVYTHAGSSP